MRQGIKILLVLMLTFTFYAGYLHAGDPVPGNLETVCFVEQRVIFTEGQKREDLLLPELCLYRKNAFFIDGSKVYLPESCFQGNSTGKERVTFKRGNDLVSVVFDYKEKSVYIEKGILPSACDAAKREYQKWLNSEESKCSGRTIEEILKCPPAPVEYEYYVRNIEKIGGCNSNQAEGVARYLAFYFRDQCNAGKRFVLPDAVKEFFTFVLENPHEYARFYQRYERDCGTRWVQDERGKWDRRMDCTLAIRESYYIQKRKELMKQGTGPFFSDEFEVFYSNNLRREYVYLDNDTVKMVDMCAFPFLPQEEFEVLRLLSRKYFREYLPENTKSATEALIKKLEEGMSTVKKEIDEEFEKRFKKRDKVENVKTPDYEESFSYTDDRKKIATRRYKSGVVVKFIEDYVTTRGNYTFEYKGNKISLDYTGFISPDGGKSESFRIESVNIPVLNDLAKTGNYVRFFERIRNEEDLKRYLSLYLVNRIKSKCYAAQRLLKPISTFLYQSRITDIVRVFLESDMEKKAFINFVVNYGG